MRWWMSVQTLGVAGAKRKCLFTNEGAVESTCGAFNSKTIGTRASFTCLYRVPESAMRCVYVGPI